MMLWDYYWWTGDREPLAEHFEPMCDVLRWYADRTASNGLVGPITDFQLYLDWPKDLQKQNQNSMLNMLYLYALRSAGKVADLVGKKAEADRFRATADALADRIRQLMFSADLNVYTNGVDDPDTGRMSDQITQQANALAILLDLSPVDAGELGRRVLRRGSTVDGRVAVDTQPYFFFYVLQAMAEAGLFGEALEEIRSRWGEFFDRDAVTFWEHWPSDLDERQGGMSLCHAWSAAPTYHLSATLLGVRPTKPGFAEFEVAPRPAGLEWAKGKVPTPECPIAVAWQMADGRMQLEVDVPENLNGTAVLPDGRRLELSTGKNKLE